MKRQNKRILITGGAGFLGSHLCEALLKEGHDIICVDNLFTGSKENIRNFLSNDHFEFIRHDITAPLYVEVDEIYNLACPASPVHYQHNPIKTMKTAFIGTMNMLGLAKRVKAKILHASTSEIYGDPEEHPQTEQYRGNVNPIGLRACYDEGKRAAETLCFDYYRQHNIPIKVVRIFNTYGPKMHPNDGRVVSNFIMQALQNKDITIYGDGTQTRSFCYVDDLIKGFIKMMETPQEITGPMNLGNTGEFTIRQLAEEVIKQTQSKSKIIFKPLPQDDPRQRKPDTTLAQKHIKWQTTITFEQGLTHTIAYFKDQIKKGFIVV